MLCCLVLFLRLKSSFWSKFNKTEKRQFVVGWKMGILQNKKKAITHRTIHEH